MRASTEVRSIIQTATLPALQNVAKRHSPTLVSRLAELRLWLANDLRELEAWLSTTSVAPGTSANLATAHMLLQKGKRLRALVTMLAARLTKNSFPDRALQLAVAVELVHAATLLHDDVIDESQMRRDAPTAHILYGNSVSILAGDAVLVEALRLVADLGNLAVVTDLLDSLQKIVAAEALQLDRRGSITPDRQIYLQVAEGKTATLFGWALASGAAIGGSDSATCAIMRAAGRELGVGFQMIDDLVDLAPGANTGKDTFSDIREGKFTWPLILAAEIDPDLISSFQRVANGEALHEDLVRRVIATGALAETKREAALCGSRAIALLEQLPRVDIDIETRARFCDLIAAAMERQA